MVDPEKIKDISEWPVPKGVTDIRSFMGLTSYYRRFIQGFLKITYPITYLQNKGVKFAWSLKYQEKFENLKILLTMAPILKLVDTYEDYTVCTDANKEGLGGVLSQEGHVVCFESHKLKEHE